MILNIRKSPVTNKRYRAEVQMDRGIVTVDFGQQGAFTYVDGETNKARENYWKRHTANEAENDLIRNLIISPATLSAYLLWGRSRDLKTNMYILNRLLAK
jgi:hypothetical protein